ncbi:hypothetical protein CCACVL1_22706 [Corchorus capsularis]|uniref:Uncharacterized protein n=1 Tax=Corchorus capsularis TaxID=210143 RepID=A0A1R3GXB5_COCAP|nr:hypothetical protein CCACVL1_22706 [Corchorus capsularis]
MASSHSKVEGNMANSHIKIERNWWANRVSTATLKSEHHQVAKGPSPPFI